MTRLSCCDRPARQGTRWQDGGVQVGYTTVGGVPVDHAICDGRAAWVEGRILGQPVPAAWALAKHTVDGDAGWCATAEGDFVIVIADGRLNRVWLYSNRHDTRAMYYARTQTGLVWATELKTLVGAPGLAVRIDSAAVDEFLSLGVQIGERTWFEDVSMLGAARCLTATPQSVTYRRYWHWPARRPLEMSDAQLVDALGERLVDGVKRRVAAASGSVGLGLSGGLDSRALVAALPTPRERFHTVAYGTPRCLDRRIAARVAHRAGTQHHALDYDVDSWMVGQSIGVWHGDGTNFVHSKGRQLWDVRRHWYTDNFHGAGGDGVFGGAHLFPAENFSNYAARTYGPSIPDDVMGRFVASFAEYGDAHAFYIEHRIRRFTLGATTTALSAGINQQFPFLDHALQDLLYQVPAATRCSGLYARVLLRRFPELFKRIPWQATGRPLRLRPPATRMGRAYEHVSGRVSRRFQDRAGIQQGFQNPAAWMRKPPARAIFEAVFHRDTPHFGAYVDPKRVQAAWRRHLAGANEHEWLCRVASLEWWLERVLLR